MFKIGDFSKLSKVSIRMIRYYDEIGLLVPASVDSLTGYRYYAAKQIGEISKIILLRDIGFTSIEIFKFLSLTDIVSKKKMLESKKIQTLETVSFENHKLEMISSTIRNLDKERSNMDFTVIIKSIPSYKVVSLRQIIPAYDQEGILWHKIGGFVQKQKIKCVGLNLAIYHDESCKDSDVDVEVVMQVDEFKENKDGFVFKNLPSLEKVVSILIPGDYSNIATAFEFLGQWIYSNHYSIVGNVRQIPIKGPWSEKNPDDYLTEIQFPVEENLK